MGDIDEEMVQARDHLEKLLELVRYPERSNKRWQQEVINEYTKFARVMGIVAKDSDPFGPLDFLSKILYEHDCHAQGKIAVRWHKLSAEVQEQFRQQGIQTVASWANEEMQMLRLSSITPLVRPRRPGR